MTNASFRAADFVLKAAFITTLLILFFVLMARVASADARPADVYRPVTAPAVAAAEPVSAAAIAPQPTQAREVKVVATMPPIADEAKRASLLPRAVAVETAANVDKGEEHCLATAIYFEARGESEKGQQAVAEVILARTKTPGRPSTVCGVVYEGAQRKTGCQFSFTCDRASNVAPPNAAWLRAQRIASDMLSGALVRWNSLVRGATFYHANSCSPSWASRMEKVATIGSHIFYRPKGGRYS